jgi:hypothetical protein
MLQGNCLTNAFAAEKKKWELVAQQAKIEAE